MYQIIDLETENHRVHRRLGNPFSPKNYIVAAGWKTEEDTRCSWAYFPNKDVVQELPIDPEATVLVGHNIKYDLLWLRTQKDLQNFLRRGGSIWCTQLAEYLLEHQKVSSHMNSMDEIIESYGGKRKLDKVKLLWEQGVQTSKIPETLLIDYLVGTESEGRLGGDIGNTERIYLGQLKRAEKAGMLTTIRSAMEALLCTTEMEYNGLRIDVREAKRAMLLMEEELDRLDEELQSYIPDLPEGLDFNWASTYHKSYLIFGGSCKYRVQDKYIDPKTGKYAKKYRTETWPVCNSVPVHPDAMRGTQDVYLSGKNKGNPKFATVKVPDGYKTKYVDKVFKFPGYTKPKDSWATSNKDAVGAPVYQTNDEVLTELSTRGVPFLQSLSKRQSIQKDLGTYYLSVDKGKIKGMLTCVQPSDHIVHHSINHTSTVTSRLSSSDPNLQNVPRADTSEVKKMFISRFGSDGVMMEADFSQLEIVGQGVLTGDKSLLKDLIDKIDFHCKRVANKYGCTYDEAVYRCKDPEYKDNKIWKNYRTKCKEFSFQRAYGAGAASIAASTGMSITDVEELIASENLMYPGVESFYRKVADEVAQSAKPFKDYTNGKIYRRGVFRTFTGRCYSFRSYDAMDFQQKRGIRDSFLPTEMKNYPIQGFSGEVVQIVLGKLIRNFIKKDNYGNRALLCNTVHDSVWLDVHNDVVDVVAEDVKRIMEGVPQYIEEMYNKKIIVPFPVEIETGTNLYNKTLYTTKDTHDN